MNVIPTVLSKIPNPERWNVTLKKTNIAKLQESHRSLSSRESYSVQQI